ncbi:DnaJ domain protein [Trichophyton verrucosum HKI 0517]|uniref:DnaJ domain protein n=1 Tax=Trichophyton verrucosum (strain HKI 0517) TaxID=663202 RepID=D4DFK0_TRIVH|nr:DnaJ domain protein [Trichophyton verrucosum HKI 0517]EFE39358.1 DnaJ domain protein [Trichophyton verrucosum HKI 0517]
MADNGAWEGSRALPGDEESIEREYDLLSSYADTTDYYSLLGLSRDPPPTGAAIRSAYRTLTLSFHPDKHPSHLQEVARKHFGRIQTAYETLIDPKKRVVYELMGEEGVQKEWGQRGVLGASSEAENMQLGVKAMDQAQFRRWFVRKMKEKERSVLEDMVSNKIEMQLGFDATMFETTEDIIYVKNPKLMPSSLALGFRLNIPFPSIPVYKPSNSHDEDEDGPAEKESAGPEDDEEDMQLVIHANVAGNLRRMRHAGPLPGTGEDRDIEDHEIKNASLNHLLFPFLGNSSIEVGASLLPVSSLNLTVQKFLTPISGTYPFHVTVRTNMIHVPLLFPPHLHVLVQRRVGQGKVMICNWSSGFLNWPNFISNTLGPMINLIYGDYKALVFLVDSKFELGLKIFSEKSIRGTDDEHMDEDEEEAENSGTWSLLLHSSPTSILLTLNYEKDLFTTRPEQPALSQWSYEGYTPPQEVINSPPVRLEVTATTSMDLSIGWMISGSRKVGNFTRMGLGIGMQGNMGLVCSITWSRLGQKLTIPIAICPLELVNTDIASMAVMVPWLTYALMEFGFWRPRQRRKQKKAIAKQQRRVQRLMAKRRAESLEAIELMKDHVTRRQDMEEQRGGLVILHAEYGYIPPESTFKISRPGSRANESMVDVTIPVAALVDQGQLNIPRSIVKSEILGFSDPAPFMPKVLRIQYIFGWKKHSVEIPDGEDVICPMQSHLV